MEQGHLGEDTQLSLLKFRIQFYKCTVDCAMCIITPIETVNLVKNAQLYWKIIDEVYTNSDRSSYVFFKVIYSHSTYAETNFQN